MLLIYADEAARPAGDEAMAGMLAEHERLIEDMIRGGAYVGAHALQPVLAATSVRRNGKTVVPSDGPFAETKEQLAGAYIVDCADLDQAIAYAARIPDAAWGTVEVRPIWEITPAVEAAARRRVEVAS
ncbi:MAG: YciI family protein [Dehalococcoidia bacterium]